MSLITGKLNQRLGRPYRTKRLKISWTWLRIQRCILFLQKVSENAKSRAKAFEIFKSLEILDGKDKDGNEVDFGDEEQGDSDDLEEDDDGGDDDEDEQDDEEESESAPKK